MVAVTTVPAMLAVLLEVAGAPVGPTTEAGVAFIWRLPRHCDIEPTGGENSDLADSRRQGLLIINLD